MKYVTLLILFCVVSHSYAQNILNRSLSHYQNGRLSEAKVLIDSALTSELYASENITWYLKGFIYKDLYKKNAHNLKREVLRSESLKAFNQLLQMDTTGHYTNEAKQNIRYLATTYFNEAMDLIDQRLFNLSKDYYNKFENTLLPVNDGNISVSESKIQYFLALGSAYVRMEKEDSLKEYNQAAVQAFEKVLVMDSTNKEANYNVGVIYYNQAVSNILDLDYDDADILAFGKFEDRTIRLFKRSLPYMVRAYEAAPDDQNILEGLAGIHFGLREFEESNKYKKELLALKEKE